MGRNRIRIAATVALVTLAIVPAVTNAAPLAATTVTATSRPTAARPGLISSPLWGYVVVRRARSVTYTPAANDRGNVLNGVNSVTWTETGHYEVRLPGLANDTSAVALSPLGTVARRCVVQDWFIDGADELIDVACFALTGVATDSQFVLTFLVGNTTTSNPTPTGYAYSFADQPTTNGGYLPSRKFNSHTGSSNPVNRVGTGSYQADFNALGSAGGNVQVAAVSNSAMTCQSSWAQVSQQMQANVQCRTAGAARVDSQFDVILTNRVGLKGEDGTNVAYLTADRPTASSYTASAARRFSTAGMAPTITRSAKGVYLVTLRGMPLGGAAVVTPLATAASMCSIASIAQTALPQRIGVRCFDPTGQPKDTPFSLSYLR